jgi:hypothetical protein
MGTNYKKVPYSPEAQARNRTIPRLKTVLQTVSLPIAPAVTLVLFRARSQHHSHPQEHHPISKHSAEKITDKLTPSFKVEEDFSMKIAVMFGVAALSLSGSSVFAQQASAGAQTNATVGAGNVHASSTTDANASTNRTDAAASTDSHSTVQAPMHPVNGELVGKLDSKTAKSGDTVVVKTSEAFRTSEGVVVPKGSRLVGHVTEVQAHGSGSQDSHLGIAFDRAEVKGGQSVAMQTVIESVAPPANAVSANASMDSSDGVGTLGGAHAMGSGHSGGGLLGGTTATTAGVGSNLGHTVGGSVGAANGLASGSTAGNGLNGAAGATGSLAAHATAIPGVMLAGAATASTSGVLSASKHNVHLDSGTQMTLGVAGAVAR